MVDVSASSSFHRRTHSDLSGVFFLQTATGSNATEAGTTGMADTEDGTTAGTGIEGRKTIGAVVHTKAFQLALVQNGTRSLHLGPRMIDLCLHPLRPLEAPMAMVTVLGA